MKRKKLILFAIMTLGVVATVFAQDSTATEPGGFGGFYDKYKEAIFIALGAGGVITWLMTRLSALRNAVDLLLAAGDEQSQDGKTVSLEEWQGIIAALKAVFWKGEPKKVKDLKKPNQ